MLNDVCKKSISDRLVKAMDQERFRPTDVAEGFGISPSYISMMKKKVHWKNCPAKAWETVLAWVNSGDALHRYFELHPIEKNVSVGHPEKNNDIEKKKEQKESPEDVEYEEISLRDEKFCINFAELGWIIGAYKSGKTVEQISKEFKIYDKIVEAIVSFRSEGDSGIKDPLLMLTNELDKAKRALSKSTESLFKHDISIELHITHVTNLIPKIHKLQDAVDKLSK